jgi:hypothetical protein
MLKSLVRLAVATLCGLIAACQSGPPQKTAQDLALERYSRFAGPPIPYFTWLGRYDGWEPLGKDHLVIFTTANEAYLLKVWAPCDLRFVVDRIGITSTTSTVYARLDAVTTGRQRCPIDEIRKIDYTRMRHELRAQSDAAAQPAQPPAAAPPPGH